ncbi:putative O-glycosylation ligase, exosortase A system-associated [Noviherbaspirillum galbum]|uniref:Putative O-glycosylation ligase, exosortase A system-associated n=1 Tax=Noviherbaspirillum galbum TaxID=2709383 RepID=A0A6B3SYY3_9BURK|nr:putative O-glycosylation ligase, exosortase A system-associated [Noviherbaspirillum galbum]NEX64142.1 putative O-glycosylation ligase, exosortase A system-associated [Noviherbaspirillum galbum]
MRDILIVLIVFGTLPMVFKRPYVGVLLWVWISVMNPHTQAYGFAVTFPFAQIIAGVTVLSLFMTSAPKALPMKGPTIALIAFTLWMNVSTAFSFFPEYSLETWNTVMKIMFMTFVTMMIIKEKKHIQLFIGMLVLSLGFYGVKGGIFTILSGGSDIVWGPGNTFIGGNNEIALALIMTIPLMHYLQTLSTRRWQWWALSAAMGLSALAAIGSYSRGALLAIVAMSLFMTAKSRYKMRVAILVMISLPLIFTFMPEKWANRMDTIQTYQKDDSAMGRINAWWMAFNLASDRPLTGGGFQIYEPAIFQRYAPVPDDVHAAHSIYFQALGEHGFVGLGLYLLFGILTWRTGTWIIRETRRRDDLKWAFNLATMIQVSMIGFAVGGAFLSLLYFDVPYYLMVALVATRVVVEKQLQETPAAKAAKTSGARLDQGVPEPLSAMERGTA